MCLPFGVLFRKIAIGGFSSEVIEQIMVKSTQFEQNWVLFFQKWYTDGWVIVWQIGIAKVQFSRSGRHIHVQFWRKYPTGFIVKGNNTIWVRFIILYIYISLDCQKIVFLASELQQYCDHTLLYRELARDSSRYFFINMLEKYNAALKRGYHYAQFFHWGTALYLLPNRLYMEEFQAWLIP